MASIDPCSIPFLSIILIRKPFVLQPTKYIRLSAFFLIELLFEQYHRHSSSSDHKPSRKLALTNLILSIHTNFEDIIANLRNLL